MRARGTGVTDFHQWAAAGHAAIVAEERGGTAEAIYLVDLALADRAHALGRAGAVLSHDTSKELRPDEIR